LPQLLAEKAPPGVPKQISKKRFVLNPIGKRYNLRGDGLASILGNLGQSVFGEPAYPTIESKAAHFLYFVVKNHPL